MSLDFFLEFRTSSELSSSLFLDFYPLVFSLSKPEVGVEWSEASGIGLMDGSGDPAILVDDSEVGSKRSQSAFLADALNFLIFITSDNEITILIFALTE